MNSKKNILFVHEVASQAEILSSYLIEKYSDIYDVKRIIYFNHKYYKTLKYPETVFDAWCDIGEYKKWFLWQLKTSWKLLSFLWKHKRIILQADVIHFFSGSSFFPKNIDIFFLKFFLKKKIIMEYNGSEMRQPLYSQSINIFYRLSEGCHYFNDKQVKKKLLKIHNYFDVIIVPYPELILQIKNIIFNSTDKKIQFLPHIIDIPPEKNMRYLWKIKEDFSQTFTIIHAPSNKNTKGSVYIQKIVHDLQKKYPYVIYKELHNIPREEVLREIKNADCVIDQMLIGDIWIFALEALAYGTPVFAFLLEEVYENYPKDFPVINANLLNLFIQLESFLRKSLQDRIIISDTSRNYTEKNHSLEIIWEKYRNIIAML